MRQHLPLFSTVFSNDPKQYSSCIVSGTSVSSCTDSSSTYSTLRLVTTSTTFSSCNWNSCSAPNDSGSAIQCTGSEIVLTVEKCFFISCSSDREGGAIHTSSIHTLDVKESFFYKCSTSTTSDNHGSGAIWIYGIQQKLSIVNNDFISCTSTASGGAFIVWKCFDNIKGETISSCRYIDCNATDTTPDGGAVWIWDNSELIGVSECLFSICNSYYGGGLDHYLSNYDSGTYPIRFCFFNKNVGDCGNDVHLFLLNTQKGSPFLQCFSTTEELRIGYLDQSSNGVYDITIQNAWLPLGTLLSLNAFTTASINHSLSRTLTQL